MLLAAGIGITAGSFAVGDEKPKSGAAPFGLSKRVPWTASKVVGSPEPPPPYRLARVYPELKFDSPVCLAQEPGTSRMFVAEQNGKILSFDMNDPKTSKGQLFLDTKRTLYAFSFHPQYEKNGQIFVFTPTPGKSRVSRYLTTLEHPRTIKPDSETIIIEWPSGGHNGGEAIIGPDGYLYIGTGDGTSGSDPDDTGQGVNDLLAVIMRLDVDHPEAGKNYSIPKDNPFIKFPGARPEIWAFGVRNPWRMSFDFETGRLWVGDVGQDIWEMIRVIKRGGNYGWSVQEGSHPFHPQKKVGPGPILPPVVEHHHTECRSITGGYVYHGTKFPELDKAYVYGDYQYGKIWALRYDGENVTWHKELADTAVFIASFTVGRDGDFYAVDNSTGFLHVLERTPPGTATGAFPKTLSETGVFASVKDLKPSPGVLPYSVNAPQWADGAQIERLIGLPGASQITDSKDWGTPNGMVAVQTLSLEREAGNPQSRAPIETRILVKQDEHWMGYSYLWNDAKSDATLVGANGAEKTLTIKDSSAPGGKRQQTWRVPGRAECMFCHSRAAGFILGLNTSQMNRDHDYGEIVDNQIRALNHAEVFKTAPTVALDTLPKFVNPYDTKADLNDRARTYLHVNCSICHVVDGGGNSFIELNHAKKLEETLTLGKRPAQGTFGINDAMVITPGDPGGSVLYYRLASLGGARMPRVGSRVVDDEALRLISEWIAKLPNPSETPEAKSGRQQRAELLKALHDPSATTQEARAKAIGQLIATTSGAIDVSRALGQGDIPAAVRAEVLAAAKALPSIEVRDLFERFVPESERVRRLGDRFDPQEILGLKGDAARGRAIFTAESIVNCKSCHRINNVGTEMGADLAKIGAKYPRAELLQQILEPSRVVDPKYTFYQLSTTSGLVHTGLLDERTDKEIVLRGPKNDKIRVPVSEVEALVPQKQSIMPDLLLRSLTAQEAADLLEYLTTLR